MNLHFSIGIIGGYLSPGRFQSIEILLPLILSAFILLKMNKKYLFYTLILSGGLLTLYACSNLPNDYTFYSMKDFRESVDYLNSIAGAKIVFSGETAILSEINHSSLINFYSPFQLRNLEDYYYPKSLKNENNLTNTREELIKKLKNERPSYIFGSERGTFILFNDYDLKFFLSENYFLEKQFGRIKIYKLKS